ncbi:peptidase inhibitor family I36 protein [Micromonospora sp. RTGN7]|uniref:peptidase inhibitor family I36 protein n=1 Tax=Micromonospora sp. RTGN7 TaxID=3016526 RepID=UPI0029FF39A5|nr:peptidase inhibitor family I36 protein [Micromonospora sp. RTGN7]
MIHEPGQGLSDNPRLGFFGPVGSLCNGLARNSVSARSSVWNRTGQKLTIFDNANYTGTRVCLNAGGYVAELGPERSFDNEAESYKLAGNCL